MMVLFVQFFALSGMIILAGVFLTRFADSLADRLGLTQTLGGLLFLAFATSLPELAVNLQAAALSIVDLAVGSTIGSSLYNLLILALLDLGRKPEGRMLSPVAAAHGLSATAGIVLVSLACLFIALPVSIGLPRLSLGSILIALTYVIFLRLIFFDQRFAAIQDRSQTGTPPKPNVRLPVVLLSYTVATCVVFGAATLLVPVADRLAQETGLGQTFVGTAMVALASSLPEIVTTVTAVRMGAMGLAAGNIFGSNAFNMVTLFAADIAYHGDIMADASDVHVLTGFCVVIVTSVCLAGLLYRPDRKGGLEPDAKVVVGLICAAFLLLFFVR